MFSGQVMFIAEIVIIIVLVVIAALCVVMSDCPFVHLSIGQLQTDMRKVKKLPRAAFWGEKFPQKA